MQRHGAGISQTKTRQKIILCQEEAAPKAVFSIGKHHTINMLNMATSAFIIDTRNKINNIQEIGA